MSKERTHALLIIPGLGDGINFLGLLTKNWYSKHGITPILHSMDWKKTQEPFSQKQQQLTEHAEKLSHQYDLVSVLGVSGGGSAGVSVVASNPTLFHAYINALGRLKAGQNVHPTLQEAAGDKTAFIQSVQQAEQLVSQLHNDTKQKMLTIRPLYDEMVPISTVPIEGATNIQIPSAFHVFSIFMAMKFPGPIIDFLRRKHN